MNPSELKEVILMFLQHYMDITAASLPGQINQSALSNNFNPVVATQQQMNTLSTIYSTLKDIPLNQSKEEIIKLLNIGGPQNEPSNPS